MVNFPNATTSVMESIIFFHDYVMMFLLSFIPLVFVGSWSFTAKYDDCQFIEAAWTVGPILLLSFLVAPSLRLLYVQEGGDSSLSVKAIGRQWYWSYDRYDSFLIGPYRLLDTDLRLGLPLLSARVLVTAGDVLHSWTVPSMGVKADAVPGRINNLCIEPKRPGVFYGQCSEICGSNHSFMPIAVECAFNRSSALKAVSVEG